MRQFVVTPAAGKRLIARALAREKRVLSALESGTVVIVAGSTNGYVAEELLGRSEPEAVFSRHNFVRGLSVPPGSKAAGPRDDFPGDVILRKGRWLKGKTIFDVIDELGRGDLILKGANALDPRRKEAGVLIGDSHGGTAACALRAVVGRRVPLVVPVGLEKCVPSDIGEIAADLNAPGAIGVRMLPLPGEVFTEIEAVKELSGAETRVMAAGGVCGAEGAVWLAVSGSKEEEKTAEEIMDSVSKEPHFSLNHPDPGY
jgi:hypothetical protein